MVADYFIPTRVRLARSLLRPTFRLIFHALSRVKILGKKNVPPSGAYLIAFNHISLFEPPLICAFWPIAPEAMGAAEIWARSGQSLLARWYGGIPVHRDQYDRHLIEIALNILRSGYPLVIAPEGERSHTPGMQPALKGVAFLMDKAKVPVVPVGIIGNTENFLERALHGERPQIEMRIGQPLAFPPVETLDISRREARQRQTDLVMTEIAALLPPEYRGVYSSYVENNRKTN
ncbi:lysophospholipid acyltransferase family protein [Chloroflexota bacterium]